MNTKPQAVAHTPSSAPMTRNGSAILNRFGYTVALKPKTTPHDRWHRESKEIVRAVNSHAALVDALSNLLAATAANYLPGIPELEDAQHHAQYALALAKEVQS